MEKPIETDWSLLCKLCSARFLSSESTLTSEGFIVCPHCRQWSGHELKVRKLKPSKCEVYAEPEDRLISNLYAWVAVNPKTTLQGFCGVMIDNIPHQAVADSIEGAMKFLPFIDRVKTLTGKKFQLIGFEQSKVYLEV